MFLSWGRKDGFPGADGSTITQETGTNTNAVTITIYNAVGTKLEESITGLKFIDITNIDLLNGNNTLPYSLKHPLTFIHSPNITPWDWFTNNKQFQDNTLWDSSRKSNYDPCPYGWRVPGNGTWNDLDSKTTCYIQGSSTYTDTGLRDRTNGRLYESIAWYPCSGYRRSNTGTLAHIGFGGYVWSSSSSNIYSKYLNFNMSDLDSDYEHNRSLSLSIRCVQE